MFVQFILASALSGFFGDLPEGTDPGTVSRRITEQFLSTRPENYQPAGYQGNDGYGRNKTVSPAVASLWANAIACAHVTGDKPREEMLVRLFYDFLPGGCKHRLCPQPHGKRRCGFGQLPLEIYLVTKDKRCYDLAMSHVRVQDNVFATDIESKVSQIDDVYRAVAVLSLAYRVTRDRQYVDKAANRVSDAIGQVQIKGGAAKGLFSHANGAHCAWGRGCGKMAAAMALLLDSLPQDNAQYGRIMDGYRLLMETLLPYQRPSGLWCQLVDRPDDSRNWEETSATAMITYAYLVGVRRGWLDAASCGTAARKAYLALCDRMDAFGNLGGVSREAEPSDDLAYYYGRGRVNGDPHGQAPMLWIASVLLEDGAADVTGVKTPETSKLFERRIDPVSGVVSYSLLYGQPDDNRQSLFYVTKSMTEDGRFLLFLHTPGNERTKRGMRKLMVADLVLDQVREIGSVPGTPYVDAKENYIVFCDVEKGFFRMNLDKPGKKNAVKLRDIPIALLGKGKIRSLATYLTLTQDRQKAFLDASVIGINGATNYFQGLLPLGKGNYEPWGQTQFPFCNGQLNPTRDDMALGAWDVAWMKEGRDYQKKTGWYPRMWLLKADGTQTMAPARDCNMASQEIWDDDGGGFSWCGNGVSQGIYHHDLATGQQTCLCPVPARHDNLSPDKKYVVYDSSPSKYWRGCKWRVGFWNRDTKRNVWVYSTRPALTPITAQSRLHPDPHPHFVCRGKYVVSTACNADGHMDVYVTPVDQLIARTTMSPPPGKRIAVTNPIDLTRYAETVSVKWFELGATPEDPALRVWDVKNCCPVPWQDDGQGNLIFVTRIGPKETREFVVVSDRSLPAADQSVVCWSQHLPERMDDFAWENDRFGARVYGPVIMEPPPKGQKLVSSGIDIINKCVGYPVLHRWFARMKNEGSYHQDHGEGMDNYKVGPSRGCGGIAARKGDEWKFSSNWVKSRTLSIGPVRTTFELTYADWCGLGEEIRRVTLDRGHDFARFEVSFANGPAGQVKVGPGLDCSEKRQHNGRIARNFNRGWIANWEPANVDGKDTGTIGTGILLDPSLGESQTARDDLGCEYLFPSRTDRPLVYWAGATWSGAENYNEDKEWFRAVEEFSAALSNPLVVTVR